MQLPGLKVLFMRYNSSARLTNPRTCQQLQSWLDEWLMREGSQLLAISIVVGRNAHASVAIAMIASLMHDRPACAGRGQISVPSKYRFEGS